MIKSIIFDLDGTLVDTVDIHFNALNDVLRTFSEEYVIGKNEEYIYNGLPTKHKFKLLTKNKQLPIRYYDKIYKEKQKVTQKYLGCINENKDLQELFDILKNSQIFISIASNAVHKTVYICLEKLGLIQYCNYIVTNEDVYLPKPNAEMYLRCMIEAKSNPDETLIVEDSPVGHQGAVKSGGILYKVKKCPVTKKEILDYVNI